MGSKRKLTTVVNTTSDNSISGIIGLTGQQAVDALSEIQTSSQLARENSSLDFRANQLLFEQTSNRAFDFIENVIPSIQSAQIVGVGQVGDPPRRGGGFPTFTGGANPLGGSVADIRVSEATGIERLGELPFPVLAIGALLVGFVALRSFS